jgi:hypothetical protein
MPAIFKSNNIRQKAEQTLEKGVLEDSWTASGLALIVDRLDQILAEMKAQNRKVER